MDNPKEVVDKGGRNIDRLVVGQVMREMRGKAICLDESILEELLMQ